MVINNSQQNSNRQTTFQIPNYQIVEIVYSGSRTLVYRAIRTSDQLPVAIKLLKNEYPTFSELVQFRNQYTIAKNLNSPLIVQTYSLEPYRNGYALIMEDFGGISLQEWAVKGKNALSLREFLEIAIALCNALDILYRYRIIHKDIKPANILINPETKQVKLIDFSIASLLPRETQTLINPNVLEGTLAYISPEQTGRMNRGIDYRTDFYSLGVTFYELLTGKLPFESNDPMELVHCHIAKASSLVHEINPKIPSVLSEIVTKMMAKNAEDRYQSALGLKFDLENCLQKLQVSDTIESFEIGQRDLCDRFTIPDKLYGREAEVLTLLQAFERVSLGATEMMLVAGFSGIGKTVVISEVHKPIVRQRGYFIKGKYDQFQRNIPLSAFVQAFRDLMGQLLSESDRQIQTWKTKILEAVGDNGQVLIEVIPELERIIGVQAPATELSGTAAQNRFNLSIQKFVQTFTSQEHPLVMFLDDLQWADSASLKLLQLLIAETEHLLILGAYRDNEVSPAHPFSIAIDEIIKTEAVVNTIVLQPLTLIDMNQLVADTLDCVRSLAQPLTELVVQKTQGNPFFATQFLKALYEDRKITFDWNIRHWRCDIAEIKALALTNDVVEFMALQLQKLPAETQDVLKLAACVGAQFDLHTLAIISEKSSEEAATDLWRSLQEGLIIPNTEIYKFFMQSDTASISDATANPTYRFLHDRVQQAAYSLIPNDQKQTTHYQIGQLLLQQISTAATEDRIFEIVNQLNYGTALITQQTQREELAQLNLTACRKAKAATAYQVAREYANTGLLLLGENAWQQQYEVTLALHELAAEVAMLGGDFEAMNQFIEIVIVQAHSLLEKINVYRLRIQAKSSQNKLSEAIAIGTQLLQQLGVAIAEAPTPENIQQSIQEINDLIDDREIADFANLPMMTDATQITIIQIASSIMPAAFLFGSPLFPFLTALTVKLSLRHGNINISPYNYICYSMVACNLLQDVDLAIEFSQLAVNVVLKLDAKTTKPQVLMLQATFVLHRKFHIKETLPLFSESYAIALEVGNLLYAGQSGHLFCLNSFWCGQPLTNLEQDTRIYYNGLVQINQLTTANYCRIYWQSILNLLGFVEHPTILSGSAFQETEYLPRLRSANDLFGLYLFDLYKLTLCFLFGEIEAANYYALEIRNYLRVAAGRVSEPAFYLYDSLIALAMLSQPLDETSSTALERVAQNQTKLQHWAYHAPMNHQHKVDLVEAQKCRVLGHKAEAIEFYDKAISGAKANEYIQEEALANELAAKFYLDWDKQRIAQEYMTNAYYGYARWGAKAKVADLEKRYPQLLAPILEQTHSPFSTSETSFALRTVTSANSVTSHSSSVSDTLDLAAILKASQTLSGEIELEKLLSKLLAIVIENAGADKCVLMLLQDDRLLIEGSIIEGSEPVVLQCVPVEESEDIPLKLIYKVQHNRRTAVLINPIANPTLANDPYIIRQQPQSILCNPILYQGKLLGILYLENNLVTGAFTSDRVELLNLLCTQAAISLENARLYERSRDYAQQVEQSLAELSASNSRFEKLVDNVPGVVYQARKTADGVRDITYISADCYDLLELTPEQAIANMQFLMEMLHPDHAASYQQSVTDSIQTLSPLDWSGQIITSSGIVKWVHVESRIQKLADETLIWDGLIFDISDRKLADKSLRLTQFAVDRSSVPVWWIKPSGQISYVNDTACRDLGYSRTEILQKHVWDFNPELSPKVWEHHWQECKEQGSVIFETYNFNKSGHRYPVEVTVNYLELDGEEYNCAFVKNISDRKQAEAALYASQQRLSLLIQQTPMAVIEWSPDFLVQSWNPAAEKIFGYTAAEVMGRSLDFLIADETVKLHVDEIVAHLLAQTGGNRSTNENITKTGEIILCDWYNNPLVNEDGDLICIATIAIDITDLKQAEKQLQASQQLLEMVLNTIPHKVFWKDCNLIYQGSNRAFAEVIGFSSSTEIVGKSDYDLSWTAEQSDWFREWDRRVIEANIPELGIIETTLQADGTTVWIETSKLPLHDPTGTVIGVLGIYQDISDRKLAETLIAQKSQELEQALQNLQQTQLQMIQGEKMSALGNLVAGVAHEINNPVGFIGGNIQPALDYINDMFGLLDLIQQKYPQLDPQIQAEIESIELDYIREDLPKLVGSMREGIKRIQEISTSLRTFSRADTDRPIACNIHDGIDSTIMILKHRLKANESRPEITVIKNYGNLPQVECYAGQLNQVFMNILANAIDALDESNHRRSYWQITNQITITTELSPEKKQVIISIKDNGMGMSEEVQQNIFEHLFTTKGMGKGTGLGLAIARQIIIEKHQGTIIVNSEVGRGTEFIIQIPLGI